jgi:hypothetical protein
MINTMKQAHDSTNPFYRSHVHGATKLMNDYATKHADYIVNYFF